MYFQTIYIHTSYIFTPWVLLVWCHIKKNDCIQSILTNFIIIYQYFPCEFALQNIDIIYWFYWIYSEHFRSSSLSVPNWEAFEIWAILAFSPIPPFWTLRYVVWVNLPWHQLIFDLKISTIGKSLERSSKMASELFQDLQKTHQVAVSKGWWFA